MKRAEITVFGADWCGDTQRLLQQLRHRDLPFHYVNIDEDTAAEAKVIEWNGGKRKIPVVQVGAQHRVNPDADEVEALLANDRERLGSRRDSGEEAA